MQTSLMRWLSFAALSAQRSPCRAKASRGAHSAVHRVAAVTWDERQGSGKVAIVLSIIFQDIAVAILLPKAFGNSYPKTL